MAMVTTVQHGALQRRRIIERPRLIALLDGSKARVRTLVAPAGYGKTTLADQWIARDGRRGAWFRARRSSTDVAALALGLARASGELVPDCDARLREHLRALPTPAENVEVLAELLGEDLASWPAEGWLVIDEYQELAGAAGAERFIEALVASSPIGLLVAGRQRPSWVKERRILYGDVLELNQEDLAMDADEAADLLAARRGPSASDLVALAKGWPAVIGLASVSTAEIRDEGQVPESLYRFFAEEIFGAFSDDVQAGLVTLVVAPVLDRALAVTLLGPESADAVCTSALDVGIMVERGSQLDLHPLARAFLEDRGEQLGFAPAPESVARCLHSYRERRDWDTAFDLIARRGPLEQLEPLLREALDELLETARLSTIEAWCDLARRSGPDTPAFALARAEVALRHGRFVEAQAQAKIAASEPELKFRALSTAGRAAHLASREEEALGLYRQAEIVGRTEGERRDALWGQLTCLVDLELAEEVTAVEARTEALGLTNARETVRAAGHRLYCQHRFGAIDLAEADMTVQLLGVVGDPLVESGFQSVYSAALSMSARYEEAQGVAMQLLATAQRYRLDFAMPYAHCAAAVSYAGLRDWLQAEAHVDEAVAAARTRHDQGAQLLCYSVHVRLLVQQGRHKAALTLPMPQLRSSLPAARAEVLCSRALALASANRIDEARAITGEARGTTRAVEPIVLTSAVDAISALRGRERDAIDLVSELEEAAFSTGGVDLLVTAYRGAPDLLNVLLRGSQRDRVLGLVQRVGDDDLAEAVGRPIAGDDARSRLSEREREVYDQLCQGLTNRQIATLLFISEATVKVHVHHIYDKLGTRSRTALTVHALLERAGQATSAIEGTGSGCDSELL
jgi:ATP/maltotriose-dependent transcriptional regulator MalT